ncbi:MAG: hypothetical protein ACRD2P_08835 [Terriglobia bacterium]
MTIASVSQVGLDLASAATSGKPVQNNQTKTNAADQQAKTSRASQNVNEGQGAHENGQTTETTQAGGSQPGGQINTYA